MNKWDTFYLDMAGFVAKQSRDLSTKVGAVIVGPTNEVRGLGYNDFPRGINDSVAARRERPTKYLYTCHAEMSAISSAAKVGTPTKDCTIYTTHFPCARCAHAIIQSGISRVVYGVTGSSMPKEEFEAAREMFQEAGLSIVSAV